MDKKPLVRNGATNRLLSDSGHALGATAFLDRMANPRIMRAGPLIEFWTSASRASLIAASLGMASCGGGGGGGSPPDGGVNPQLLGALGDFKLLQDPQREFYLEPDRLISYLTFSDAYNESEGRVLPDGRIQFCEVAASSADQVWWAKWDGSASVAVGYQDFQNDPGVNFWIARSASSGSDSMQGRFFFASNTLGRFQDPDLWQVDGYLHLSDGAVFLAIDRQIQISRAYDMGATIGRIYGGFIDMPLRSTKKVAMGHANEGICLHYVLDASGSLVSARGYDIGWPLGTGGQGGAYVLHRGADRYVIRYYDGSESANFVFNAAHQLERVTPPAPVEGPVTFSRLFQSDPYLWQSEQFVGEDTGWRVMSLQLNLGVPGPAGSQFSMREVSDRRIGIWPSSAGGVNVVAIGTGGRAEWGRSYDVPCTEYVEDRGGESLLLRCPDGSSSSTSYLKLDPANGAVIACYEVMHGSQLPFSSYHETVSFSAGGGSLGLIAGGGQAVLVTQASGAVLPSAWRMPTALANFGPDLFKIGGLAGVYSYGPIMFVSSDALSRAAESLACWFQVSVAQRAVQSSVISALTQQVVFEPDLQVTAGSAPTLQPVDLQSQSWTQSCSYQAFEPLDPCVSTIGFQRAPSSSGSEMKPGGETWSRDRRKQRSRRRG